MSIRLCNSLLFVRLIENKVYLLKLNNLYNINLINSKPKLKAKVILS